MDNKRLASKLAQYFKQDEFEDICFKVNGQFSASGPSKLQFIASAIGFFERRGEVNKLIVKAKEAKPRMVLGTVAKQLSAGEKFKLAYDHKGLEAGFVGTYTGKTEYYDGKDMLCVIGDDDNIPYLIHGWAEIEFTKEMVIEQAVQP